MESPCDSSWFRGVTVSTQDSESCDPSSNLGGTFASPGEFCLLYFIAVRIISINWSSIINHDVDSLHFTLDVQDSRFLFTLLSLTTCRGI